MDLSRRYLAIMCVTACTLGACGDEEPNQNSNPDFAGLELVAAFPNLDFDRPVDLQNAGDDSDRIFVVEQQGVISVFPNQTEVSEAAIFLDIEDRVDDAANEEGLLGLAFHPNYQTNGYLYVNYTANPSKTIVARYQVMPGDPNAADPASEQILLEFDQPFSNHNGGQLAFGPDGYLYIAVGDGGSGGDPQGNGQNPQTLLGSILRIDVDQSSGSSNYGIPADNPFAGHPTNRPEIYAYGLRNPWRISFDSQTGQLWAGDVGQNELEEIDIIERGNNYGWNVMEASACFQPSSGCDTSGLSLPIWEYGRQQGDVSVTGGHVYRGSAVPMLQGLYVYGDFASSRIWVLDFSNLNEPVNTEIMDSDIGIASFGVDEDQELYVCAFDGKIYKFVTN